MHFASIFRFNFHVPALFCHRLWASEVQYFVALHSEKIIFLFPLANTELNRPFFLVLFEPISWLLTNSLQFKTTFSNVSTLMKYVLEWPYLEKWPSRIRTPELCINPPPPVIAGNVPCPQKPFQNFDLCDNIAILYSFILVMPILNYIVSISIDTGHTEWYFTYKLTQNVYATHPPWYLSLYQFLNRVQTSLLVILYFSSNPWNYPDFQDLQDLNFTCWKNFLASS